MQALLINQHDFNHNKMKGLKQISGYYAIASSQHILAAKITVRTHKNDNCSKNARQFHEPGIGVAIS